MPDTPCVPGEAEPPDGVIAGLRATCEGLRAANVRLRELLAEKDVIIAALQVQVAQVAELRARVEALAAQVKQNSAELRQAAVVGRAGQAGAEVAAEEDGRKPGRPKGQPGATLELTDHPDDVVCMSRRLRRVRGRAVRRRADGDGAAAGDRPAVRPVSPSTG